MNFSMVPPDAPQRRMAAPMPPPAPLKFVNTKLLIDSRDRDYDAYPSASSFLIDLRSPIRNVTSAVLISCEVPMSYYVFAQARGNTSLTVTVGGATTRTVTVPDGNYTTDTMAAALVAALQTAFAPRTFAVTFDVASMKCTVASAGTTVAVDTTSVSPTGKRTNWGLAYHLGFPAGAVTAGSGSVTGTRVANMSPENYVVVDIDELNGVTHLVPYSGGAPGETVFAKVPLLGDSYTYMYYDKTISFVQLRPRRESIRQLRVSLRFHDGTPVDLNGAEWSMTLELECTLTKNP
jgi:hypothetical protein